jgi:hypothetical protein
MDLERRFERRWAARFSGPAKVHRLEEQQRIDGLPRPTKAKRGIGGLASADLSVRQPGLIAPAALLNRLVHV